MKRNRRLRVAIARDEPPFVLIEKERGAYKLTACDRHAVRLGLTRGLPLADAYARIPNLVAIAAQPEADQEFLEAIATYCDRFTPLVALDPPHGLTLDVTGCDHLFGGEAELLTLIGKRLSAAGLAWRVAIAGTPQAAHALSRFGKGGIIKAGADDTALRSLPAAALVLPQDTVTALSRAGLKTIADLADRRSEALAARFGKELVVRLNRTLGREDVRITPLRAMPDCMVERQFAEPRMDLPGLEEVVADLIEEVVGILQRRGAGGRCFEISFFRSDGAVRRLAIETGRPSRDVKAILRLWRERMETLADPLDPGFGFDAVKLAVPLCEPIAEMQAAFGQRKDEEEVLDLVDRLITRFGRERVLRFVAQDSHEPRRLARMVPATAPDTPDVSWPAPEAGAPPTRPLQVFEPPQPIETLAEVPDGPPLRFRWRHVLHDIARAEGPERIAPEWWRDGPQPPTRDYYRVEDAQGRRFWVFRAGLYQSGSAPPRWYLHGLFA